ncbi:MAG: kelch repeat-containing protein [Deltaproteobacteria bacterium]|nr:kelch repeat-containing protein [Deltaproteobacteria bacterium]
MPTARHGLSSAVVGKKIYVIGGSKRPGGSVSNINEVFTPSP